MHTLSSQIKNEKHVCAVGKKGERCACECEHACSCNFGMGREDDNYNDRQHEDHWKKEFSE